jgi:hypothetical protein
MSSGSGAKDGRKKGRKPRTKGGRKGRDDQQHYAPPGSGGNSSRLDAKALLQSHVGVCLDTSETTSRRLTAIGKLQKCILDPRSYETIYEMYDKLFRTVEQLLVDRAAKVRAAIARVLGALGTLLGQEYHRFLQWAFTGLHDPQADAAAKALCLGALDAYIEFGDDMTLNMSLPDVVLSLQAFLDSIPTEQHELLRPTVDLLVQLAEFPHILHPHFGDLVDLLLGWTLDDSLPEELKQHITVNLAEFQTLWGGQLRFSLPLLTKLMSDVEALALDTSMTTPQLMRLLNLASCFAAICEGLGPNHARLADMPELGVPELLPRLLRALAKVHHQTADQRRDLAIAKLWTAQANRCMQFLTYALDMGCMAPASHAEILQFVLAQLSPTPNTDTARSLLELLERLWDTLTHTNAEQLFTVGSAFLQLRLHTDHGVKKTMLRLVHGSVDPNMRPDAFNPATPPGTDISLLVVECLCAEMEQLMSFLAADEQQPETDGTEKQPAILPPVAVVSHIGGRASADKLFEWDANVISLLATPPDSMTAWTAMEKLSKQYDPFSSKLARWPHLQFALLRSFFAVHKRLGYQPKFGGEVVPQFVPKALADAERTQMLTLTIGWLEDFLLHPENGADDTMPVLASCFGQLMKCAQHREPNVRLRVAQCMRRILHAGRQILLMPQLCHFARIAAAAVADPCVDVQIAFRGIMGFVGPVLLLESRAGTETVVRQNRRWKCDLICAPSPGRFSAANFVRLMNLLQHQGADDLEEWLFQLLYKSMPESSNIKDSVASRVRFLGAIDRRVSEQWAVLECARYCISSRLRTPLGGPKETFEKFERILAEVAKMSNIGFGLDGKKRSEDNPMRGGGLGGGGEASAMTGRRLGPTRAARMLLDCMDLLEKHIYNAFEGSATLPEVSKSSLVFFAGNRKVCEGWFDRIKPKLAMSSMVCNVFEAAVRYSFQCIKGLMRRNRSTELEDKKRVWYELETHLLRASRALCIQREVDAMDGIMSWSRGLLKQKFKDAIHPATLTWMQGTALHSQGRYELAIADYTKVLTSDYVQYMQPAAVEFLVDQTTECYTRLGDWPGLTAWLESLKQYRMRFASGHLQNAFQPITDFNFLNALCNFETGIAVGLQSTEQFVASGAYLDLVEPENNDALCIVSRLRNSEVVTLRVMVGMALDTEPPHVLRQMIQEAKRSLNDPMVAATTESHRNATDMFVQLRCLQALETGIEMAEAGGVGSNPGGVSRQFNDCAVYSHARLAVEPDFQDCAPWLKLLRTLKLLVKCGLMVQSTDQLCLHLSKLARKQHNFALAERLLDESGDSVMASYSRALLYYDMNQRSQAVQQLWGLTRQFEGESLQDQVMAMSGISDYDDLEGSGGMLPRKTDADLKAKAFLKLAGWLQKDSAPRIEGIQAIVAANTRGAMQSTGVTTDVLNQVAGDCINQAKTVAPGCAKAWLQHAAWCYREGHKSNDAGQSTQTGSDFQLTQSEIASIQEILQTSTAFEGQHLETCINLVCELFQKYGEASQSDEGGMGTVLEDQDAEVRNTLLQYIGSAKAAADDLMQLWAYVRRRMLGLYRIAAQSYFRYLQVGKTHRQDNDMDGTSAGSVAQDTASTTLAFDCDDRDIMVTLRLLRLLVKHGSDLEDVLSEGFKTTPIAPWSAIIPQLFARVGHPDKYVRSQVHALIARIGSESPHLIIWPAIVGYDSEDGGSKANLEQLFGTLVNAYPELIREARSMIGEFVRITVLWEELWMGTLQSVQNDALGRVKQLKDELLRVSQNSTLSYAEKTRILGEKCRAIMKPVVASLEKTQGLTSRAPETPHEEWFQSTFGLTLDAAIKELKYPRNPWDPAALWTPFTTVTREMERHLRRKSLVLYDISPKLAEARDTNISMPGLQLGAGGEYTTVQAMDSRVIVLPTKTKPKKIVLLGSDGLHHAYLVKGHEDLHLDERIMQFLSITSNMLMNDRPSRARGLRARHYPVIPLARQAGLIQWVDNTAPLNQVHKEWQRRVCTKKNMSAGAADRPKAVPLRTNDMFYAKIIPALKEVGVTNVSSRREWPKSILRKVLVELINETPRELLSNEFWCTSSSQAEWWDKTQTFARSTAVMSMVGYVLGLGDRHTDNILVDFNSGEVVHIDYNVCFEKGLRLRVPELVPFRMTHTMQAALGVSGLEGAFRAGSEHVMRVMRRNKETLLTLLEAFVYDPLVDWAAEKAAQEARKDMELGVGLSLFASRVEEMKIALSENATVFAEQLSKLEKVAAPLCNTATKVAGLDKKQQGYELEIASSQEALNDLLSQVSKTEGLVKQRQSEQPQLLRETQAIKEAVSSSLQKCASGHQESKRAFEVVIQEAWPDVVSPDSATETGENSWVSLVSQTMGTIAPETAETCFQLDEERPMLLRSIEEAVEYWKTTMSAYAYVVRLMPDDYTNRDRRVEWGRWLHELTQGVPTVEIVQGICKHASPLMIQQRAQMAYVHEQELVSKLQILEEEKRSILAADELYDEVASRQQVEDTRNAVSELDSQIATPKNRRTATAVVVLVMCSLLERAERVVSSTTAPAESGDVETARAQLENILEQLQVLLSLINQRRDQTQLEEGPVTAAGHVIVLLRDMLTSFTSLATSSEVRRTVASTAQPDLVAVNGLQQLVEAAEARLTNYERIGNDMAEHNRFESSYQETTAELERRMEQYNETLRALAGQDVSWEDTAELTEQKDRTSAALVERRTRWQGREQYRSTLVAARNAIVGEVTSMEQQFAAMLASTETENSLSLNLMRELSRLFARVQQGNLTLRQSLDAAGSLPQGAAGKDSGYVRVLLFARKMQTMRSVFYAPSAEADSSDETASTRRGGGKAVEALQSFLGAYCTEVLAPHVQVLLQKLIAGRAATLGASDSSAPLPEPVAESGRSFVGACSGDLAQLGEYHQRVVAYCEASVAMARGVRTHQQVAMSLRELDGEYNEKKAQLLCAHWMHNDLLEAYGAWQASCQHAEVEGVAPPQFGESLGLTAQTAAANLAAQPPPSRERLQMLASRPALAVLLASPEGFPRRTEMVAAVEHAHKLLDAARQQLVGAHERWVSAENEVVSTLRQQSQGQAKSPQADVQRGIETLAKKRRGVWGVVASQVASLLGISAASFTHETHSSVLTQAHTAIDSAHIALMGRLGKTLQADAAAGVEIRQGMSWLSYAAEEKTRLTTTLETAGSALLQVESQLEEIKRKATPQVHNARRVSSEIQPTVESTNRLWKDIGSLLRNVMLTTRHDNAIARAAASLDAQHKQAQAKLGDTVAALCTALEASAPPPGAPERKSEGCVLTAACLVHAPSSLVLGPNTGLSSWF